MGKGKEVQTLCLTFYLTLHGGKVRYHPLDAASGILQILPTPWGSDCDN